MRRTLGALALLTLILAACAEEPEQIGGDRIPVETTMLDPAAAAGIPPEPDQATADAYIAALDAINADIVHRHPDPADLAGDIDRAIGRGRDQCSTIKANPDDRARQIQTTNQRFTSPDAPAGWGPEVAGQILDVVHQHLCPDF